MNFSWPYNLDWGLQKNIYNFLWGFNTYKEDWGHK